VKAHAKHPPSEFLAEALNEEPYDSAFVTTEFENYTQAIASGIKMQFKEDSVNSPNSAWLWAHDYQPCDLYVEASRQVSR
jgi:hypothetical protein